ncbi:hypothetical protein [uncultured Tyzzerella sp.]|uniref:hypothetical protein n=1 Tax=uncultured Tyzzerella sp. TaxID=2321398 RepID=UPI0029436355|nr:hypothetical protein [uncultured Tyzzerella sp.]
MKKNIKQILGLSMALSVITNNVYANSVSNTTNTTPNVDKSNAITNEIVDNIPKDKNGNPLTGENLKIYNIIKDVPIYTPTKFTPITTETTNEFFNITTKTTKTVFENNDTYYMNRLSFKQTTPERYNISIPIKGNTITFRYVDRTKKEWVNTSNLKNLQHTTLFIDTDTNSYIVSVPAVYKNIFSNNTLTVAKDKEQMVNVIKKDGYFDLQMSFPQDKNLIGEYWYMESEKRLVDWSTMKSFDELFSHDLSDTRRWSYDGYYFQTPSNYKPGGKNILYKHPSNYTGASFAKYGMNPLSKNLGYVMTETCMKNQNNLGYWETGPQSEWLYKDFKIGAGFYDTRFNTDFATSLLYAYQNYNNKEFLAAAVKYAEFFLMFVQTDSYTTQNGGILVADYGYHKGAHEKTHVSLNHHLAEMNFLYEIYGITGEPRYLETANKMLLGIEDTRNQWVLPDNNLRYELYYTKNTNKMEDYPYLTYNDLFQTKQLLKKLFQKNNDTIEFLMASKKMWMDRNNITGYLVETP